MDTFKIKKDRSCALQSLEGHSTEECQFCDECPLLLSHQRPAKQPLPLITTQLPSESWPRDSASTQASAASLWSGVVSQCGSAFSRATSVASSIKSHKIQASASTLAYLQTKPLPEIPQSSSPISSPKQDPHHISPPPKPQQEKEKLSADSHLHPLISPAHSNFTISSASSYASHLVENSTDSFREHIRLFHPTSQDSAIAFATLDTGSDCCCIRSDILNSLGITFASPLIRRTRLSSKGITGTIWQPLGRIELNWSTFGSKAEVFKTWFFVGDEGLPHPVVLGKDFLFPKEGPPRVVSNLVNVLNRLSKSEREKQEEEERRQEEVARINESVKDAIRVASQECRIGSSPNSSPSSSKSSTIAKGRLLKAYPDYGLPQYHEVIKSTN